MPATRDIVTFGRQIFVERLCKWKSGMGASVDITMDMLAASNDETMESPGPHLKDEISRGPFRDRLEQTEANTSRACKNAALAGVHVLSASGCLLGWAS